MQARTKPTRTVSGIHDVPYRDTHSKGDRPKSWAWQPTGKRKRTRKVSKHPFIGSFA